MAVVYREHGGGSLQELYILRAERSSAPTDHRSKYLDVIPELCCKNSSIVHTRPVLQVQTLQII